ncbi:MAG: metallophosphoesterase [Thiohalocapsa sp.]
MSQAGNAQDSSGQDPATRVRIAHLSDLHFGREQPLLVAALAQQLHALNPDLVAISGDLTQRARHHELSAAADFLERLPQPVLVVPGNHDIPGVTPRRFRDPWRGWHRHFSEGLEPTVEQNDYIALGANSVRTWGPYLDWSRGRLRPAQIQRLAARLQRAPQDRLRILVAHHPFLLTPAATSRGLVAGGEPALKCLARAGLDLALGGHVHLGYAGIVRGVLVVHAATGVSNRLVGEDNGFNLIEGHREALRVAHWRWQGREFHEHSQHRFRRDANGWRAGSSGDVDRHRLTRNNAT